MNWAAISFDWNQIRAFLATVEEGSLSAAARVLGQSQPTLGRQIAALEEKLDVVLFERVGRSLEVTSSGLALLSHVREMADAAAKVSLAASGQSKTIDGHVRLTASDVFSAYLLPNFLVRLREKAPGITVEIVASNMVQNLQRREADIAIRHGQPDQEELYAKRIGIVHAHLYATPEFVERHGPCADFAALEGLPFIGFGNDRILVEQLSASGIPIKLEDVWYSSENGIVAWELVRAGLGIGVMAETVANRTPEVVRIVQGSKPFTFPIWLSVHRELKTSQRIRLVFDLLTEELAALRQN